MLMQELGLKDRKLLGSKRFGEAVHRMEAVSRAADIAVRKAIYDQSLAEGTSEAQAVYRAREFINFRRRGAGWSGGWRDGLLQTGITTIAFFNAYLQGTDVLVRTLTGRNAVSGLNRRQALRLAFGMSAKLLALSSVYAMMSGGDDEYDDMPLNERDKSWVLGNGLSLPVPTELGMLFKALPERIWDYYRRKGTPEEQTAAHAITAYAKAAGGEYFGRVIPLPSALKPAFETWANFSTFTGRPIVGTYQKSLEPWAQAGPRTSTTAKEVAKWANENLDISISPLHIENVLSGYLGTTATMGLALTDAILHPDRADRPLHQIVGLAPFTYNQIGTRRKDEFYELAEKVNRAKRTLDNIAQRNLDEAYAYAQKNADKIGMYKMVASTLEQYEGTRKWIAYFESEEAAQHYTQEERRTQLDQLRRYEIELAKWAREYGKDIQ
jgi:hypothetical protein